MQPIDTQPPYADKIRQTSVIIPCYNGEEYLEEALESVCRQTTPVREIIVVDDGSTQPIRYPDSWEGPTLRIVRTENRGPSAARNLGISLTTGNFVAFLDADDAWDARKIEMQEAALNSNPDAIAVFTRLIEKPGWTPCPELPYPAPDVSEDRFWSSLWERDFIFPSSVTIRRDVISRIGGFNEKLRACEDWEFWFRLLKAGRFLQVPLPLSYRRIHPNQLTKNLYHMAVNRRKFRAVVMAEHGRRLSAAGVSPNRQYKDMKEEYRRNILIMYFERQIGSVRRLLWGYLRQYPNDLKVLKYALLSLLPARFFIAVRDKAGR